MIELDVVQIVARYAAGASSNEIAASFGVSPGTIRNRLRKAGVQIRCQGGHSPLEPHSRKFCALYLEGASVAAIAGRFNVGPDAIRRRLRAAGVSLPAGGTPRQPRRNCDYCGKPLKYLHTRAHNACRLEHLRKHPRPQPRPCEQCGVVFTPRIQHAAGRFCSPEHFNAWKTGRSAKELKGPAGV